MKKLKLNILILLTALYAAPLQAMFDDGSASSRPLAMGGAFTCVYGTTYDVFSNPAGLASLQYYEIVTGYNKRLIGLTDGSDIMSAIFGANLPVKGFGSIGFGWQTTGLSGIYQEHAFTLALGTALSNNIYIGGSLKGYLKVFTGDAYTALDPVFASIGYSKTAFGAGAGVILKLDPLPVVFGFSGDNLNNPDVGLAGSDMLVPVYKAGVAFMTEDITLTAEAKIKTIETYLSLGAEGWVISHNLVLRSGFNMSSKGVNEIAAGFGYRTHNFDVNYAFVLPVGISGTMGSHMVNVSFKFGDVPKTKEEKGLEQLNAELARAKSDISTDKENDEKVRLENEKKIEELNQAVKQKDEQISKIKEKEDIVKSVATEINKKLDTEPVNKIPQEITYKAVKGDNLKGLAEKYYNDAKKWTLIYNANKDKIRGGVIVPGTLIIIPKAVK